MTGPDDTSRLAEGRSPGTLVVAVAALVVVGALVGAALTGVGPLGRATVDGQPTPTDDGSGPTDGDTETGTSSGPTATPAGPTATPAPLPDADPLDGTASLGDADVVIEGEGDDEFGYAVAVGDVNGDGTPDVVVGAPFHNATGVRSGAVFVFFGPVERGDLTVADADVTLTGETGGDWAGNSLAVADVSGDGVGDLVVGAPHRDESEQNSGVVYVVHGGADLTGTVSLGAADATLAGVVPDSLTGYSVAAANLTGDARADVVIGSPRGDDAAGRVYVVDAASATGTVSLADATATLAGEANGDEAGWRVATAANVTGDGRPAVVVGAPWNDDAAENAGAAYVVTAPFDSEANLGDAALVLRGTENRALAGWSVGAPGDVTGDGQGDVLVGSIFAGPGGVAYLVAEEAAEPGERSLGNTTALRAAGAGHEVGWVVAGAGDVDCDGRPDVLVGAPGTDDGGENAGAVHLVTDPGTTRLANSTATLTGAAAGDEVGHADALAAIPGRNTTGLVIGAPFGDAPQTVHVVYVGCDDG